MNAEPTNITSAQILSDAAIAHVSNFERPQQSIQDLDELLSYQITKRREFEQQLNKNRLNFGQWLRYAKWEVEQNVDYERARSIYERALDVNVEHIPFWVQYIQFELLHKNVNHARNLLDRATTILPRVGKLWFLYVQTEERLKNYIAVRTIFERWMHWHPDELAWDAYVSFEIRYDELDNARKIFDRYVTEFPKAESWLKYIDFELREQTRDPASSSASPIRIRQVFERAVDTILSSGAITRDTNFPQLIKRWTYWEASQKEAARARHIYSTLLDKSNEIPLTPQQRLEIKSHNIAFNKSHGDRDGIVEAISAKRAEQYEETVSKNTRDYDTWWALLNLYEDIKEPKLLSSFERVTLIVPLEETKSSNWRKYVMIVMRYALWMEYEEKNIVSARDTWIALLGAIPHTLFTFAKVWIGSAEFEIRNSREDETGLLAARKILGRGIGISSSRGSKPKLLKYYIGLETKLGEWNRVRKIYERWIELSISTKNASKSSHCPVDVLLDLIAFESGLGESERCVALYKLGLQLYGEEELTPKLEPISKLWESYTEFHISDMAYTEAREVYIALTRQIGSPKVWIAYALFESSIPSEDQLRRFNASKSDESEFEFEIEDEHRRNTRKRFEQALVHFDNTNDSTGSKIQVLESWKSYEEANGDQEARDYVSSKFPVLVRKRKTVDGVEQEYLEYEFPQAPNKTPATTPGLSKFLANAKKWALENST